jgi:hypothetical protein
LNRTETISPETVGIGAFIPTTAPFVSQPYPAPWAPMYPPNRAGGWGYAPTVPWPVGQTPLNSQSVTGLLVAGGAINPLRPQAMDPQVMLGLAQLQQAEAGRVAALWGLPAAYQGVGAGWAGSWAVQALSWITYGLVTGECGGSSGGSSGGATPSGGSPPAASASHATPSAVRQE